jgi:tight adherence protein B
MDLLLAIVAAAAASATLVLPTDARSGLRRWRPASAMHHAPWLRLGMPALAVLLLPVAIPMLRPEQHHVLVAVTVIAAVWSGLVLARRERQRARRASRRRQAVDICDALVTELRSGQPPGRALTWVARSWPDVERASTIAGLGGDVPGALRRLASRPGAEPLARIAAGWEVAHRSGAGLADVLDRLSRSLRDDEDIRREISASLGPTRATARLLAVLPAFGLGLGYTMGADPMSVLVGSTLGALCLAAGAALAVGGLFWVEHIADRAEP